MAREFRILSPTAILGYGFPEASFRRGLAEQPQLIAVDAGSTDPGPYYLGAGKPFTDRHGVKRDLRYLLTASASAGIPLVIGSAGGCGARPHLDWCREIVLEIAREEELSFKLAVIPTDVPKDVVHAALATHRIEALDGVPALTPGAIDASTHIVAQIGVEPIVKAMQAGAQVVLAGRAYDPTCFAALPIMEGFDEGLALHCGKILECAAIAATPGSGADCVLGILKNDSFLLKALSDERRFTAQSAAAHTLYEKSDPYLLPGPGGVLDLTSSSFTELGNGIVKVRGSRHRRTTPYKVKLEGAAPVGFRSIAIAGVRDPVLIGVIDETLAAVRSRVQDMVGVDITGQLFLHVYGKNGVMGDLEPLKHSPGHELGIVIDAVAPTQERADTLCSLTRSTLLHYGYPGRVATAGNLAFPFSPSDFQVGAVYEFSLYHLMELPAQNLFPVEIEQVGVST